MCRFGILLQRLHGFVEQARRFRTKAVAVEVEVDVFEHEICGSRGLTTWIVTASDAVPPLPSSTVIVACTGPSTSGAVHAV